MRAEALVGARCRAWAAAVQGGGPPSTWAGVELEGRLSGGGDNLQIQTRERMGSSLCNGPEMRAESWILAPRPAAGPGPGSVCGVWT